jgi:hypothetical protein
MMVHSLRKEKDEILCQHRKANCCRAFIHPALLTALSLIPLFLVVRAAAAVKANPIHIIYY